MTLAVYLSVTTWRSDVAPNPELPDITEMVETLAERLRENPDDVTGWLMLGRSYVATGRYPEALVAFREAWDRTPSPGVDLKVSIAEVEVLTDPSALGGSAGLLFDQVLEEDPGNEKALWYGGLAALQAGDADLVRQRWSALLAIGVPEQMAQVMREQLAALPPPSGEQAPSVAAPAPDVDQFAIQLNVTFGGDIADAAVASQAALFVFARAPEGGPPLAVIRESAAAIPGEFALSDANAMIPGRSLADFESLMLVARVSNSGQPTEQPGDLFGELEFRPGEGAAVADLVIDQVVP